MSHNKFAVFKLLAYNLNYATTGQYLNDATTCHLWALVCAVSREPVY